MDNHIELRKQAQYFFNTINYTRDIPEKIKWDPNKNILIGFINGTDEQKANFKKGLEFWACHVNLTFELTANLEYAVIRVAYDEGWSYSYIGKEALDLFGLSTIPTISIGWNGLNLILKLIGNMIGFSNVSDSLIKREFYTTPFEVT